MDVTTSDPDGNTVAVRWWRWDDADSYAGAVDLQPNQGESARLTVPKAARSGDTIHLIAEATDDGVPALVRYERFRVTVAD